MAEVDSMVEAVMQLAYPGIRTNILAEVESLADTDYQRRAWLGGEYPPGVWDDLTLAMNVLLGDTPVCLDPEEWVGVCIFANEVASWRVLGMRLAAMLDDLGDAPDAVYLADPRWEGVVEAARTVRSIAVANERIET